MFARGGIVRLIKLIQPSKNKQGIEGGATMSWDQYRNKMHTLFLDAFYQTLKWIFRKIFSLKIYLIRKIWLLDAIMLI